MKKFLWIGCGILLPFIGHTQATPSVTMTATPNTGISPVNVTLNWTSTGVTACTASGGWSGVKAVSGTENVVGLKATTTFTLTCTAGSGTAKVTWTPPTQNTDGSPLTDLKDYLLYYSNTEAGLSGASPTTIVAPATTYSVTNLSAGTWYFGMKSRNAKDITSVMSNTASKNIVLASAANSVTVNVDTQPKPPVWQTVEQVAYEVKEHPIFGYQVGRVVGTVPVGTICDEVELFPGGYHEVPLEKVTLDKMPKLPIVVARCELV